MYKPLTTRILLTPNDELGRIAVNLEAFFEFNFDITEQLADMVDRFQWLHSANSHPPQRGPWPDRSVH